MRKRKWCTALVAVLAGCATGYSLVRPGEEIRVGPYLVSPQIEWSSIRGAKGVLWTVDGLLLDALHFPDPIRDGDALFATDPKAKVPRFRTGMIESETAEFVVDSFSAAGAQQVVMKEFVPKSFAGNEGFSFEVEFLSEGGLEKRALVFGTQRSGFLHLVIYHAARQYYFDKYLDAVSRIIASIRIADGPAT